MAHPQRPVTHGGAWPKQEFGEAAPGFDPDHEAIAIRTCRAARRRRRLDPTVEEEPQDELPRVGAGGWWLDSTTGGAGTSSEGAAAGSSWDVGGLPRG